MFTCLKAYLDMTDDVEEYFYELEHPRAAAEKSFLGSMQFSNLEKAEQLLSGADPVNVNCAYPGGLTALHMAALNNDAVGIQFLLRFVYSCYFWFLLQVSMPS